MEILKGSGLSHFLAYDCAFISAYRAKYTKRENLQRSSNLAAKLISEGYGVASVVGRFRDGGQDSCERTFFVVNFRGDEAFARNIISYGKYFEQDAVLIIPKGAGGGGKRGAYSVRMNACEKDFSRPLNENKKVFRRTLIDREIRAFFARGRGRDFEFLEKIKVLQKIASDGMSLMSRALAFQVAQKRWEKTEVLFLGSCKVRRSLGIGFFDLRHGIPEDVPCEDVYGFVERVVDGFGGRDKMHRLTGAKGECYGVDEHGNYWIFLPMGKGATNGATFCHITWHLGDGVYSVRFLLKSSKSSERNNFSLISEHVGLKIDDLKPLYQKQTDSYLLFE